MQGKGIPLWKLGYDYGVFPVLTLSRLNYGDKKCLILMYIPLKNHNMFGLADRNRNTIVSSKTY